MLTIKQIAEITGLTVPQINYLMDRYTTVYKLFKMVKIKSNKRAKKQYVIADDDFQKGKCVYERSLSEQWVTFATCIGKTYNHEEFLRLLQKLSPSIPAFKELYPIFLDIRVIGRAEVVSKPFYVNGEAETGCKIKFKMQGGEDETVILPESFVIRLPYAKGNYDKLYDVEVQLVFDNKCGINVLIQAPLFEQAEEKALLDEVEYLKSELNKYEDLLVLFNF